MTTKEMAQYTLDKLMAEGWQQHDFYSPSCDEEGKKGNPRGPYCLGGPVYLTDGSDTVNLYIFAKALGFPTLEAMYKWNDAFGRTREEVFARLKAVIDGE